jgi:hypothetical protein
MLRITTLLTSALAAVVLGGCSASSSLVPTPPSPTGPEAQAVRKVIVSFASAMAQGDGSTACALLDGDALAQITEGSASSPADAQSQCAAVIAQAAAQLSAQQRQLLSNLHVGQLTIDSDTASVDPSQLQGPAGQSAAIAPEATAPIKLARSGNSWLIENLG